MTQTFRELTETMRPQDRHGDGAGLRFETGAHAVTIPITYPHASVARSSSPNRRLVAAEDGRHVRALRATLHLDDVQELSEIPDGLVRNLQAHYNVAPTDPVNVLRLATGGATELVSMR